MCLLLTFANRPHVAGSTAPAKDPKANDSSSKPSGARQIPPGVKPYIPPEYDNVIGSNPRDNMPVLQWLQEWEMKWQILRNDCPQKTNPGEVHLFRKENKLQMEL